MNAGQITTQVVLGQLLLGLSTPIARAADFFAGRTQVRARQILRLSQVWVGFVLLVPLLVLELPGPTFSTAPMQVWSAPSMQDLSKTAKSVPGETQLAVSVVGTASPPKWELALRASLWFIFALYWAALLRRIWPQWVQLARLSRESHRIRRVGRVEIRAHDRIHTPFAFLASGPGSSFFAGRDA